MHEKVEERGYKNISEEEFKDFIDETAVNVYVSKEFFRKYKDASRNEFLSEDVLGDIISEMKKNIAEGTADFRVFSYEEPVKTVWGSFKTYQNTPLQENAVKNGINAIKEGKTKLLLAAVMRFGKTHVCYDIVNRGEISGKPLKNILVVSGKADVRESWKSDINHVSYVNSFVFVELIDNKIMLSYKREGDEKISEKEGTIEELNELERNGKTLIFFDTLQDLSGSLDVMKAKHYGIMDRDFDMMIIDETHYGLHAMLWGQVTGLSDTYDDDFSEEDKINQERDESVIKNLSDHCKVILQVSGTPYYILMSSEFNELLKDAAVICTVSYSDMIEARDKWINDNPSKQESESPYFGIPTLYKIGLKLNKESKEIIKKSNATGNINAVFELDNNGKFKYENAVKMLFNGLFKKSKDGINGFLAGKSIEDSKCFRHTIAVFSQCKQCYALKDLLSICLFTKKSFNFFI